MWTDPILAEVRAIRQQIAAEAQHDLHRICEEARAWERANTHRLAPPPAAGTSAPADDGGAIEQKDDKQ